MNERKMIVVNEIVEAFVFDLTRSLASSAARACLQMALFGQFCVAWCEPAGSELLRHGLQISNALVPSSN